MDEIKRKMVRFDNRVSWMDLIAIGGAAVAIANSFYGTGKEVQINTAAIKANQVAIERMKRYAGHGNGFTGGFTAAGERDVEQAPHRGQDLRLDRTGAGSWGEG